MRRARPAADAPVIDVGTPAPVRATVIPPPPEPDAAPTPAGVVLGDVPLPLPPHVAAPVAELHGQALALVAAGTALATSVHAFLRALEGPPPKKKRRARPRRR